MGLAARQSGSPAKEANRALAGLPFADKRIVFEQSPIVLTRLVAEVEGWTTDGIANRQSHLAELAVRRWRY